MNHLPQLSTAAQLLEAAGLQVKRLVDDAQGLDAKIELAGHLEAEAQSMVGGIVAAAQALLAQCGEQTASLMTQRRDAAVAVVAAMLADGSLGVEQLTKIAGVAMPKDATWVLPSSADQIAAMNAAEAAKKPATAAAVARAARATSPAAPANASRSLRENMAVQAGYLNPVKYRDPVTGAGWSGRGPMPKWLKDLAADGKSVEDYRVDAAPVAAPAAQQVAPVAKSPAGEAPAPAAAEPQAASKEDGDDLGTMMSFDATNFDADVAPAGEGSDDIGDIVDGIAAMKLPGSEGIAGFMAV